MPINFNASPGPSLGVELELILVDRDTRELVSAATPVLDELACGREEGHPRAKHELFECTVELITGVCTTAAEARSDLATTLEEVRQVATGRGLDLASCGTHPFSPWRDQQVSPSQRYAELVAELQWTARRLAIYGAHFHVGVPSGEEALAVASSLRHHLPLLLALSASSPYWEGEDSGLASARSKVFEGLPTAGLHPTIGSWSEFEGLMETLVSAECIRSVREIWWDVRPHPDFGTVELRMCDAPPTLTETVALAALAQCLVVHLGEGFRRGALTPSPPEWMVRENKWLAARWGMEAQLITDRDGARQPVGDLVRELVADLAPTANRLGCSDELDEVLEILTHGPGYVRQRAVRAAGGTPVDVVDALVRELATDQVTRT